MDKAELKLRESIVNACRSMNGLGINQGTSGNISARYGKLMLITPSGVPYEELKAKDLVTTPISGKGDKWNGALAPSSEWRFHLRILQDRPQAGSVVHTHSTYATTLAICNKPIPAIHYMVAAAGGSDIRCADYATFGTQALADNALVALHQRKACLLAHHGVIACGPTLDAALSLAVEVENLARTYATVRTLGEPRLLDDAEMERVLERFRTYGQPRPT